MRIDYRKTRSGFIEWKVIISTIPDNNISFFFSFSKNCTIINTGINNTPHFDMWFIFFHFFYSAFMFFEIGNRSEPLNFLFNKIAIRHRVSDRDNLFPGIFSESVQCDGKFGICHCQSLQQ